MDSRFTKYDSTLMRCRPGNLKAKPTHYADGLTTKLSVGHGHAGEPQFFIEASLKARR